MRRWNTLAAVVLFVSASAPAFADGMDAASLKDEEIRPLNSWSGIYFGVHGGTSWGDADITENLPTFGPLLPPSLTSSYDVDGEIGGVHLGVNKQMGNLVVGAEVSLSGADINGSGSDCFGIGTLISPLTPATATCESEVSWLATATAKLGYAQAQWMVYLTGGWAVAGVDHKFTLDVPIVPLTLASAQQDTADGFAYGVGGEYALTDSVSIGAEYLHADLESSNEGLLLGGILTTGDRDIDLDILQARLNFKWGGEAH